MKHPTQEQWMEFLYDELPSPQRKEIEQHLRSCPLCERQQAELHRAASTLNAWKVEIPPRPKLRPQWTPVVKWAAAAALLMTTAFATGRLTKTSLDSQAIESQIKQPLEEKLARDLDAKLQQAAERTLVVAREAREKVRMEFVLKFEELSEKALADAAASKEQLSFALAAVRDQDKALYAALQELESRRQSEYRSLREDLEKVAVFADQSLKSTERQFFQLASYKETAPEE